jgi:hypothetical protein
MTTYPALAFSAVRPSCHSIARLLLWLPSMLCRLCARAVQGICEFRGSWQVFRNLFSQRRSGFCSRVRLALRLTMGNAFRNKLIQILVRVHVRKLLGVFVQILDDLGALRKNKRKPVNPCELRRRNQVRRAFVVYVPSMRQGLRVLAEQRTPQEPVGCIDLTLRKCDLYFIHAITLPKPLGFVNSLFSARRADA